MELSGTSSASSKAETCARLRHDRPARSSPPSPPRWRAPTAASAHASFGVLARPFRVALSHYHHRLVGHLESTHVAVPIDGLAGGPNEMGGHGDPGAQRTGHVRGFDPNGNPTSLPNGQVVGDIGLRRDIGGGLARRATRNSSTVEHWPSKSGLPAHTMLVRDKVPVSASSSTSPRT